VKGARDWFYATICHGAETKRRALNHVLTFKHRSIGYSC
jgi:hypothetical protein